MHAVTIPVISVSQTDGAAIRAVLASPPRATIRLDPHKLAGTDSMGRPKMYAPDPIEPGSSVSHWDTSAQPNLLMEPNINSSLGHGIDLSRDLFADIGWYSDAIIESFLRHYVMIDRDRDGEGRSGRYAPDDCFDSEQWRVLRSRCGARSAAAQWAVGRSGIGTTGARSRMLTAD